MHRVVSFSADMNAPSTCWTVLRGWMHNIRPLERVADRAPRWAHYWQARREVQIDCSDRRMVLELAPRQNKAILKPLGSAAYVAQLFGCDWWWMRQNGCCPSPSPQSSLSLSDLTTMQLPFAQQPVCTYALAHACIYVCAHAYRLICSTPTLHVEMPTLHVEMPHLMCVAQELNFE
jgi:hypothetical protein